MPDSTIKDFESLPVVLNAKGVQAVLGLSKGAVYELFKREDFPAIQCGRRLLVSRDAFRRWLEQG